MRLPNYKLRYNILLRMYGNIDYSVSEMARGFKVSNVTIYNNIDDITRDLQNIKDGELQKYL